MIRQLPKLSVWELPDSALISEMRKKRISEGYSLRALADIVGVSFSTLARMERGEGYPDYTNRQKIRLWLSGKPEPTYTLQGNPILKMVKELQYEVAKLKERVRYLELEKGQNETDDL